MIRHQYILKYFDHTPWAILPEKLAVITDLARRHVAGETISAEERAAIRAAAARPEPRPAPGAVAVIPVVGTIIHRGDSFAESSGAMSVQRITQRLRAALADATVGAIVLDVDSPGGGVPGVEELAAEIFAARGSKPIIAQANTLAASAAYWIASAADELVVSPSGLVGSIGVYAAHVDWSQALEQEGLKVSLISAGKYKVEGNPYEPLGDEARASWQTRVDETYDAFTKAVARHRGVKQSAVQAGFGEGRVVGAREALRLGMADRVATLDETISRLVRGQRRPVNQAAAVLEPGDNVQAFEAKYDMSADILAAEAAAPASDHGRDLRRRRNRLESNS